jgi:carboxylate-amine ligase
MADLPARTAPRRRPEARDSSRAAGIRRWARWDGVAGRRYTLGVEEEVMLLDPFDHSLAGRSDQVLPRLSEELMAHLSPETHTAVVEIVTGVHANAPAMAAELSHLRERLALELRSLGVAAACAGMHPDGPSEPMRVSPALRYRVIADTMGFLAHRQPTLALHVHVGVPDPEDAIRVLNQLRESVPILLALSANSPFLGGRDSGFSSARTAIFGGFPRTGAPRAFSSYADYVEAIDILIASGALPDPTFLWWDVRLQPALGTVEVRVMDAQSSAADSIALIALIQSLARLALEGARRVGWTAADVLAENRFLGARDGLDAYMIDPVRRELVSARALLDELLWQCRPHAAALGCVAEFDRVDQLALNGGAERQRRFVSAGGDLASMVAALADEFTGERGAAPCPTSPSGRSI